MHDRDRLERREAPRKDTCRKRQFLPRLSATLYPVIRANASLAYISGMSAWLHSRGKAFNAPPFQPSLISRKADCAVDRLACRASIAPGHKVQSDVQQTLVECPFCRALQARVHRQYSKGSYCTCLQSAMVMPSFVLSMALSLSRSSSNASRETVTALPRLPRLPRLCCALLSYLPSSYSAALSMECSRLHDN